MEAMTITARELAEKLRVMTEFHRWERGVLADELNAVRFVVGTDFFREAMYLMHKSETPTETTRDIDTRPNNKSLRL